VTLPINNAASFSRVSNNKTAEVIFIGEIGTQIASGLAEGHSWYFYALNVESLDCFTAGINDLRSDIVRRYVAKYPIFPGRPFLLVDRRGWQGIHSIGDGARSKRVDCRFG
jgi:hypothetical protein